MHANIVYICDIYICIHNYTYIYIYIYTYIHAYIHKCTYRSYICSIFLYWQLLFDARSIPRLWLVGLVLAAIGRMLTLGEEPRPMMGTERVASCMVLDDLVGLGLIRF